MTEQLFISKVNCQTTTMLQNNSEIEKKDENASLSYLSLEVDDIFFGLRKADQLIRRELHILKNNHKKYRPLKKKSILPIDECRLKKIIEQLPTQHLWLDDYIIYMLEDSNNSIFKLIKEYNEHIDKRNAELIDNSNTQKLIDIDEKLVYYIRHIGAMTYHLNIHLNLLTVLLKNSSVTTEAQQTVTRKIKDVVTEYMVKEWGEQQQDIGFREVTLDGPYAIVSWVVDHLGGDAILLQHEGYWQLISIRTGRVRLQDFENANVSLEVARRILGLHYQKLGY